MVGNFLSRHGLSRCACEELQARLSARGWTIHSASRIRARLPRLIDMCATVLRRAPASGVAYVDVFSGDAFLWAELACWLLRRLGTPYVLALRGGGLPEFFAAYPARGRRLLQSARAVAAPSTFLQTALQPFRDDIAIIPNAVDTTRCRYTPRQAVRPRLVWLRAFHRIYAPEMAVQTLAILRGSHPDATLLMIGGDKGDGSLQATQDLCRRLGLADAVPFTGAVPKADVGHYLNQGDIFLNTTTVDNTPVSVLEAMACGLCVVSTDPGGIRHLLQDGITALLTPCGQPEAMAAAVLRLLDDPMLSARLSMQAHHVAGQCDWDFVLPQWERLLTAAAQHRARRPESTSMEDFRDEGEVHGT